jgi:hypothetical protein
MGVVLMGDNWTRDTKGDDFRIFQFLMINVESSEQKEQKQLQLDRI